MIRVQLPISDECIKSLQIGDQIEISGIVYVGRDAALPKLVKLCYKSSAKVEINLEGGTIFHSGVSPAGIGPTSSNKFEIESTIGPLSEKGIKIHLGKGSLSIETIKLLNKYSAIYAITPPVTALLTSKVLSKRATMFKEEGMEALYELEVSEIPVIVAIAHGRSIFDNKMENI